ncbi:hypothetical protein EYF80_062271 [Liparis tanakae]|uniref:Uncharacterized protein n=1 Tax=Liparis tanakae TaxID=230148 RepID=A0A4Z2EGH9_9TELE|nr:hypothetical protein EYF80_062271 [Liparis tanakae]
MCLLSQVSAFLLPASRAPRHGMRQKVLMLAPALKSARRSRRIPPKLSLAATPQSTRAWRRTQEAQLVVVHDELDAVNLQRLRVLWAKHKMKRSSTSRRAREMKRSDWSTPPLPPPHPADERQRLALLLVAEQRDALHQVGGQDEVLDAEHLVDVELRVDEGHARQVVVLQHPQEDLREHGRTFCPMADTRYPWQWHSAVTGPFCSFSYRTLNLFLSGVSIEAVARKLDSSPPLLSPEGEEQPDLVTHPPPAADLLALHQAGARRDVALQARHGLLAPQGHRLHAVTGITLEHALTGFTRTDTETSSRGEAEKGPWRSHRVLGMASQLTGEMSWMEKRSC